MLGDGRARISSAHAIVQAGKQRRGSSVTIARCNSTSICDSTVVD
jgi:hypothetical protein